MEETRIIFTVTVQSPEGQHEDSDVDTGSSLDEEVGP